MHYVTAKGILSAQNGMNLYRGCSHGCIYCDSRSKCYQMHHEFEDIEIKENAPRLLESALRSKRKKCMIGTGAMTDPYLHVETQFQMTRMCLEIIHRYGFGLAIQTKSDRIRRDYDLLQAIHAHSKCVVQMTLTTYDESLCRILEPHVCTTAQRFEVLKELRDMGIPTVVWLDPILPYINDTKENLLGILNYCFEAKVYGIICFGMGLTLRDGNREYFYQQLDHYFPGLRRRYEREYGLAYEISSPNNTSLMKLFYEECKKHKIVCNNDAIFQYLHTYESNESYEQLSLF